MTTIHTRPVKPWQRVHNNGGAAASRVSIGKKLKTFGISLILLTTMVGCATSGPKVVPSANQNTRVNIVVIHFTSSDFEDSLNVLTVPSSRPVSSHYLVPEPDDPSYSEKKLQVYQLVNEEQRAWHAGVSYWAGKIALNDMSIGIELVNRAWCHEAAQTPEGTGGSASEEKRDSICFYPDYTTWQLDRLAELLQGILERNPDVKPVNIIGHSDIAPQRKIDPGPRFPWQRLHRLGFGAWYDDETVVKYWEQFRTRMPAPAVLHDALHTYGYDIELLDEPDEQTRNVVSAFQMHFHPQSVTGSFDAETAAKLFALIEKYRGESLGRLLEAVESVVKPVVETPVED